MEEWKFREPAVAGAGVAADLGAVGLAVGLAGAGAAATTNIAAAAAAGAERFAEAAGAVVRGGVFARLAAARATFSVPSTEPGPFAWLVWVVVGPGAFVPVAGAKPAAGSPGGSGTPSGSS